MNKLLNGLKEQDNLTYTTNGAGTYRSTLSYVYDMFAQCAAMRSASDDDCMRLFSEAYDEDATLALRCLFWARDIRGGAGERRFFRVCYKWLAAAHPAEASALIPKVAEYGRYDDLFVLFGNPLLERAMVEYIWKVIEEDEDYLVYKWMPSINTSSKRSRELARKFATYRGMRDVDYRHIISAGRRTCNLVETLMSQNQWDKIAFEKLPSRAGLLYSKAFARREETRERYRAFIENKSTKVHAGTLYPYDVVAKVTNEVDYWDTRSQLPWNSTERIAINKYWDNLTDYFNGATLNALCVCDTSGSMTNCYNSSHIAPIDVAISIALYTAERARGPFKNHFISFSSRPKLIETKGLDFYDKVLKIYSQNLCSNTNIEATFGLILNIAKTQHLTQHDLPQNLIVISDMQFDSARCHMAENAKTLMEGIRSKWRASGYIMPHLIFWNVNAASGGGNFPILDENDITYVSGCSPTIFTSILKGKRGVEMMLDTLSSPRYASIYSIYE